MTRVHRDLMPHITDLQYTVNCGSSRLFMVVTPHKARMHAKLILWKARLEDNCDEHIPAASCIPCC